MAAWMRPLLHISPLETHLELDLGAGAGPVLVKLLREVSLSRQGLQARLIRERSDSQSLFGEHRIHKHSTSHDWFQENFFLVKAESN